MNCPYCDSEIDDDSAFCPKCGESLVVEDEPQQSLEVVQTKQRDLLLVAAIFTVISAVFMVSTGYIVVYEYQAAVEHYGSSMASALLGFMIYGVVDILCGGFAVLCGVFMLQSRSLKISVLGNVLLLVSVVVTYMAMLQYQYFGDILLFSEVSVLVFSILSGFLLFKSKDEFT